VPLSFRLESQAQAIENYQQPYIRIVFSLSTWVATMSINFFWTSTISRAKRLIRIVIGMTVLIVGVLMIVLPGPAVVVIPVGLMILATEFVWARKLIERFEKQVKAIKKGRAKGANES
jgi:hypothetical protein